MIAGYFHQGSGLGNQLFRYVATRVKAADLGVPFGMVYIDDGSGKEPGFKGASFMNIDWGKEYKGTPRYFEEKKVLENGVDVRSFDPEWNFIEDGTTIDGEFQSDQYFWHRMKDIQEWLKTEPLEVPNDVCVIGFRGGEFTIFPDLFLTKDYWDEGIKRMKEINPSMRFEVHTDDPETARMFFPDYPIIHDIGINWRSMREAKYAIIANSSFYILPRLLRHYTIDDPYTIAPRGWARRNWKNGGWYLPQNYYHVFSYL